MTTYRDVLRDLASGQRGYVTSRDASQLGVPLRELSRLAGRGDDLVKVARGLYRFAWFPPDSRDEFLEAVLRVGGDAYLTHDAVLALHDLGDVNPRTYRVATPHRVRRSLPSWITVVRRTDVDPGRVQVHHGIRTTSLVQAIEDCRELGLVPEDRLERALTEGRRQGLAPLGHGRVYWPEDDA